MHPHPRSVHVLWGSGGRDTDTGDVIRGTWQGYRGRGEGDEAPALHLMHRLGRDMDKGDVTRMRGT
eukprot:1337431-Rhodomonas_salina.1